MLVTKMKKQALNRALAKDLENDVYDQTENGIYFPRHGIRAEGEYFFRVNGGEVETEKNLITKEGLIDVLNTYFISSHAKKSGFYLALFSGATAPAANWTAANFASVASEITSLTEGYSNATRPVFEPTQASADTFVDNAAATARINIVTSTQLNVTGLALLTNSVRGGTSGVLISATKFPAARTFQNGDIFDVGYRFALTE